jgi:TetR/AcrR family transcriptional regulator, transcriptional repressor for nem operon
MPELAATNPAQPTRDALLDAGVRVAEEHGLAGLSVNRVVAAAGVAKGTFYVHFADRTAFVDAMHERFHASIRATVGGAVEGLEPGAELLRRATASYLDLSLANRAVKALVVEARADPALSAPMAERSAGFGAMAAPSLKALGWRSPRVAARLYQAMVSEAALMELDAGRHLPAVRRSLAQWVESATAPR